MMPCLFGLFWPFFKLCEKMKKKEHQLAFPKVVGCATTKKPAALTLKELPSVLKITSFPFWRSERMDWKEEGKSPFVRLCLSSPCRRSSLLPAPNVLFSIPPPSVRSSVRLSLSLGLISFIFGSHRSNAQRRAKK